MSTSKEISKARKNRIYELQAEVERLREALERIAEAALPGSTDLPVQMAEIARDALSARGKE